MKTNKELLEEIEKLKAQVAELEEEAYGPQGPCNDPTALKQMALKSKLWDKYCHSDGNKTIINVVCPDRCK